MSRHFVIRILLLGVMPVVCVLVLNLMAFAYTQSTHFDKTRAQFVEVVENSLYKLPEELSVEAVLDHLEPLLTLDPIANFSVLTVDKEILANRGLPVSTKDINNLNLLSSNNTVLNTQTKQIIAIPVDLANASYWLVVSLTTERLQLNLSRGYLWIAIFSLIAFGVTMAAGYRLYHSIIDPMSDIISDLRLALTSNEYRELSIEKESPYTELIETANELLTRQQSTQDEMQTYVEQSTRELRETLETVEIQNIELDIARKNALQASRAKSEFLANTSHELRTPLNGITGFTSLLLKTGLTNEQKDYLSTIEQSAQGLLTVINDILDFSKLETGQLTLEYKPIFVRELIEDVFAIYAPQAHEKNIRLLTLVNHNVPRNLLGDPQRLKQVITNLISNAIKFSARGNIVVRCNAIGEMDNQVEVKFAISDNGIGLTEEQQEGLFTAFTRVDSSDSRVQGGTGLGLAIAKGLVDRMHGEIGVESESRVGSTFWFTVRLGVDRQRISQSPLTNSLYGVLAFVYDANTVGRQEITHLLTSWGLSFLEEDTFTRICDTLKQHRDQTVDLILLDAYTDPNNFDKDLLIKGIRKVNATYSAPIILLAPPAIQRVVQDEIIGLNTIILSRPIAYNQLHQSICNLLSIAEPLKAYEGSSSTVSHHQPHRNINILVVDDNPANRKLVCEFLRPLGPNVTSVESGLEALDAVSRQRFDLILMDVQMPGMDGMETTKAIRAQEGAERTPVVALTAHAVNEKKMKLLLAGMDDFLSKPVSEEDLINTITRWVTKIGNRDLSETQPAEGSPAITHENMPETAATDKAPLLTFSWSESMSLAKNKPDLATDMLKMLIHTLDETSASLVSSLEQDDMDTLFEVNHKFHGGCCYCGVPAVRNASKQLEQALVKNSYSDARTLVDNVLKEIHSLKLWSEEHDLDVLFADLED